MANGLVYFAAGGEYALNAATGAEVWSVIDTTARSDSSAAVANGVVYFGNATDNVYALNAYTGARLWSSDLGDVVFTDPALANGVIYVGADTGNVYRWTPLPGPGCGASPSEASMNWRRQWW